MNENIFNVYDLFPGKEYDENKPIRILDLKETDEAKEAIHGLLLLGSLQNISNRKVK